MPENEVINNLHIKAPADSCACRGGLMLYLIDQYSHAYLTAVNPPYTLIVPTVL